MSQKDGVDHCQNSTRPIFGLKKANSLSLSPVTIKKRVDTQVQKRKQILGLTKLEG
jgi:hypothetical protein